MHPPGKSKNLKFSVPYFQCSAFTANLGTLPLKFMLGIFLISSHSFKPTDDMQLWNRLINFSLLLMTMVLSQAMLKESKHPWPRFAKGMSLFRMQKQKMMY